MAVNRQLSIIPSQHSATWASEADAEFGEVFTKRWVVEFILDLVGYTPDKDLGALTIVEPSCGAGAFLGPIVDRLISSCVAHGRPLDQTADAVRAFDLLDINAVLARKSVEAQLADAGMADDAARSLAADWVAVGDFLLTDHAVGCADFVVGNPPYIRLENVPTALNDAYRKNCPTMRGRSDIYVGFFEIGLELLKPGGALAFICADRWMHNQYGATLRELVTREYAVDTIVTMHDVPAFEDDVSAYPAIAVLRNARQGPVNIVEASKAFDEFDARSVSAWVRSPRRRTPASSSFEASRLGSWYKGGELWPSGSPTQLAVLTDLERRFPPLENPATGTRVGIGVATGCDDVYITRRTDLVEDDRLLPLLRAGDIATGTPVWSGEYLVNPWRDRGLVDLSEFPKMKDHFERHGGRLRARHTALKQPGRWYRTIDSVDPTLLARPKLLLPDLKAAAHPVLDRGNFYPHHNLYFVVSDAWDLEVLGGLLLSDIANLFVGAYCVKMRGGCYRFQAQYVRRIRVPAPDAVDPVIAAELAQAFEARDRSWATAAAIRAYGLDEHSLRVD
jgi:adenine-specific DNA-methyltransferase